MQIQLQCQYGDWTNQIWQFSQLVHMYMHSAPIFNVDSTTMVKMQSGATIYGMGMVYASIFNLISTMMFFMQFAGHFVTLFNMYIIKIHFLWHSMRKVLL